jgi:hypothetical protein
LYVRVTAADYEEVKDWVYGFRAFCEKINVQPGNILNFDEAGFQVGVAPREEFVPLELLEPIPDPEFSITEADIKLQLCKRMTSNPAALGLEIDSILRNMQTASSPANGGVGDDSFTMQEDYVSFSG